MKNFPLSENFPLVMVSSFLLAKHMRLPIFFKSDDEVLAGSLPSHHRPSMPMGSPLESVEWVGSGQMSSPLVCPWTIVVK